VGGGYTPHPPACQTLFRENRVPSTALTNLRSHPHGHIAIH